MVKRKKGKNEDDNKAGKQNAEELAIELDPGSRILSQTPTSMIMEVQEWFRVPISVLQEFLNELTAFKLRWGAIKNQEDLKEIETEIKNK